MAFMASEEKLFHEAIRAAPDDDAPRLMLADWLLEQGDVRGEFIQVQCELERTPAGDPRRAELVNRDVRLRERHGWRWKDPVRHLNVTSVDFRRGFIEHVHMRAMFFLREAEQLFEACPTLRSVKLSIGNTDIRAIAKSASLSRVSRLDLTSTSITDHVLDALLESPHLKQLEELDLSLNALRTGGAKALASTNALPNLKTLKLYTNHLGAEGTAELLSPNLAGLESLDLGMNAVGPTGARALADSPHLANLERLFLSGHEFDDEAKHRLRQRFGSRLQLY
ncbi:MAG TPA: TIGR02996 domain-containing protein [Pirellulales bacterium]